MKKLLSLMFVIFLISFISATPIQEFFSEDVTQLDIVISQNYSSANLYLNTSGTSFDVQSIEYEDILLENIYVSSLLNGINGKVNTEEGLNYFQFEDLYIEDGSITQALLDMAFQELSLSFRSLDISENNTIINDYLKDNPLPYESDRTASLNKDENNFTFENDKGFGDVPEEYMNEIEEIINETFYSINLKNIAEQYMPLLNDNNISFFEDIDFNYTIKLINLDQVNLTDGIYPVEIVVEKDGVEYTKSLNVNIGDIPIEEEEEEEEDDDDGSSGGGGGGSHHYDDEVDEEDDDGEEIIDFIPDDDVEEDVEPEVLEFYFPEEEIPYWIIFPIAIGVLFVLLIIVTILIKREKNENEKTNI